MVRIRSPYPCKPIFSASGRFPISRSFSYFFSDHAGSPPSPDDVPVQAAPAPLPFLPALIAEWYFIAPKTQFIIVTNIVFRTRFGV